MKSMPLIAFAACMLCCSPGALADEFVILHTNDTHSQIDPFKEDNTGGVARRKVLIDSVRAVRDNVVLVDAGDAVQGSLFFNLYKGEVEEKVLNALGYDMRILGNHEFDNGMAVLADKLRLAEAELLCANYNLEHTPLKGLFKPYSIREAGGKRIAFMPINLQPAGMISKRNTIGLDFIDETETADHLAWYLKNIEHADVVVALTHIGYYPDKHLIEKTRNIDVVIGGHSHTAVNPADSAGYASVVKNIDGEDVLIAQAGKGGKFVGEIVIDLDNLGSLPQYRLISVDSRLDSRVDPAIEEMLKPYRADIEALYKEKVTKAPRRLARESAELLNFMADFAEMRGKEIAGSVDLSIMNKGGIRNSIEKGDVSAGEIITLMPFFNTVQVIEVTGENLIKAFNTMASQNGNGVSANVDAVYDPEADECIEIKINGKDIDPNAKYRVATIDYLAEGGDYMESLTDHVLVGQSDKFLFEDMLDYFRSGRGKKMASSPKVRMRAI